MLQRTISTFIIFTYFWYYNRPAFQFQGNVANVIVSGKREHTNFVNNQASSFIEYI